MTVQELIKSALRKLGVIGTGQTPSNDIMQDSLETLNMMLKSWALDGITIKGTVRESQTLTVDQVEYSWGTGGDFTSTAPTTIISATVKEGTTEYGPLYIIGPVDYRSISDKASSGTPQKLYYNKTSPLAYLYLYPAPSSAYTLEIDSVKHITGFTSLTEDVTIPDEMLLAIKQNLTLELAPEYGRQPSPMRITEAQRSKDAVQGFAVYQAMVDSTPATAFSTATGFNIEIDE